jgi:hypothetical protein
MIVGMCIIIGGTLFPGNKLWRSFFRCKLPVANFFRRWNIAYHRPSWLILWKCNTNIVSEYRIFHLVVWSWEGSAVLLGDFVTKTVTIAETINTQKIGKIVSFGIVSFNFYSSNTPMLWIRITFMRIRIRLLTLMRIQILIFIWCGSGSDFSPWCGSGSGSRDPTFQIKAQTLEKVLK